MQKLASIFLVSVFSAITAIAGNAMGPGASGGGDHAHIPSSPFEVKRAIEKVRGEMVEGEGKVSSLASIYPQFAMFLQDPRLASLVNTLFSRGASGVPAIAGDFVKTRLDVKDNSPCFDETGKEVDASTELAPSSPICLSVSRLSQVSRMELKAQIQALLIHELAHHFGASEALAQALQSYFLSEAYMTDRHWTRANIAGIISLGRAGISNIANLNFSTGDCRPTWPYSFELSYDSLYHLGGPWSGPRWDNAYRATFPEIDSLNWSQIGLRAQPILNSARDSQARFCNGSISREKYRDLTVPIVADMEGLYKEIIEVFKY